VQHWCCVLQPSSAEGSQAVTSKLSREEENFVSELQKTYKVENKSDIIAALNLLRSLDRSVVEALSQLDASVIRRSMAGNTEAERVGERVLRRLTEFVVKTSGKPPLSSGKSMVSSGPSHSGAEKRRSDDVSSRSGQPAEKVPRLGDSHSGRGSSGFNRPQGPPHAPSVRPLFNRPVYMDEHQPQEWGSPSGRGGMMRGGYPGSSGGFHGSGYRPPPRGRYGQRPYY